MLLFVLFYLVGIPSLNLFVNDAHCFIVISNKAFCNNTAQKWIAFLLFEFSHLILSLALFFFYLSGYLFLVFFTGFFPLFLKHWDSSEFFPIHYSLHTLYTYLEKYSHCFMTNVLMSLPTDTLAIQLIYLTAY